MVSNLKQGPVLENMSEPLLTNKKQGKRYTKSKPLTLLSQPSFTFTGINMFNVYFFQWKI
jgi:hypothetical protein